MRRSKLRTTGHAHTPATEIFLGRDILNGSVFVVVGCSFECECCFFFAPDVKVLINFCVLLCICS